MSTQKHPNTEPGGTEPGGAEPSSTAPVAPAKNTAASPNANAAVNTAEPSLNRRILALAVPAFGALIAEPIFVAGKRCIRQLGARVGRGSSH